MTVHSFSYIGSNGRKSPFDITSNHLRKNHDLVIFCHGYKGFKDWGAWHLVAKYFAENGFDFLKFNFSHNGGTLENPIDFPDEGAFAANTYSKELSDVGSILQLAKSGFEIEGEKREYENIHLIGHSRGGGIAILSASEYQAFSSLVTWSAVADFGERFNFDIEEWKRDGVVYVKNARTGQMLPHNYSFYEDFKENENSLTISKAARSLEIPWLIAHAEKDEAVSFENAERLHSWNPKSHLFGVKDTGHTFGSSHPWNEELMPAPLLELCAKTVSFLKEH